MKTENYYEASAGQRPSWSALRDEHRADVCIVGGGYTGLSAALELAARGYSVVLLEADQVAAGASGRNGGQVGSGHRLGVLELEQRLGRERTRLLWDMAEEGRTLVRERIETLDIDCHWRQGNLTAITREALVDQEAREAERLAAHYNYHELEMLDLGEMRRTVNSAEYVAGRLDRGGGSLHPLRFALGLARAAAAVGVSIHENSRVMAIHWGAPNRVHTAVGSVLSEHVLLCGNAYLGDALVPALSGRVMPIVSHLLATEPLERGRSQDVIRGECCVYSTKHVVDYFRMSHDNRLIFGGGEYYWQRPPAKPRDFIRRYMLDVFPQLEDVAIEHAWSGRVAVTLNRIPDFGRVGVNGWYAHGFSGHGVALSQLAGRLLGEAAAGSAERFNVFEEIPHTPFPGGRWLRHPLMVAGMLWYALRDRF